jgi:hypothetical protein
MEWNLATIFPSTMRTAAISLGKAIPELNIKASKSIITKLVWIYNICFGICSFKSGLAAIY